MADNHRGIAGILKRRYSHSWLVFLFACCVAFHANAQAVKGTDTAKSLQIVQTHKDSVRADSIERMHVIRYVDSLFRFVKLMHISDVDVAFDTAQQLAWNSEGKIAKKICFQILEKHPTYSDVRILLGCIYSWEGIYDSAREELNQVLSTDPDNLDAIDAMVDLEYWADSSKKSLYYCNVALMFKPGKVNFIIKKARAVADTGNITGAMVMIDAVLKKDSANKDAKDEARALKRKRLDSAFASAQKLAYSGKRTEAENSCLWVLKKDSTFPEARLFLGRVYTWDGKYDSGRIEIKQVLRHDSTNMDALNAMIDLEFWSGNSKQAIVYCNKALKIDSNSSEIKLKKAHAVKDTGNIRGAYNIVTDLLKKDSANAEARAYAISLRRILSINILEVIDYIDYFNNEYTAPSNLWNEVDASYSRGTKYGTAVFRVDYAYRYQASALMYETDLYPSLGKKMYGYLNFGYSFDSPFIPYDLSIFPHYQFGASLFRILPKSFEAELGFRLLYFNPRPVTIYTGSLGKYYKNYYFLLRVNLVPSTTFGWSNNSFSKSASLTIRDYYEGDADTYFYIWFGTGLGPDDRTVETLLTNPNLKNNYVRVGWEKLFGAKQYIFIAFIGLENLDFPIGPASIENGYDYSVGIGLMRLF